MSSLTDTNRASIGLTLRRAARRINLFKGTVSDIPQPTIIGHPRPFDALDAMGVVRLLGKQQPDKQYRLTSITETAAQATEAKGEKGKIAKQIVLGIDGHLNNYQVCRVLAASSRCRASAWRSFCSSPASQLHLAEKVYPVYEAGPLG